MIHSRRQPSALIALGLIPLTLVCAATAQAQTAANLLPNPGFEDWQKPDTVDPKSTPQLGAEGAPSHWSPNQSTMESDLGIKVTGKVAEDTVVKHDGKAAARLEADSVTDIVELSQIIQVEPNSTYTVRGWVKGENIVPGTKHGGGALVWSTPGPVKDYWSNMDAHFQAPAVSTGTFDWQRFEFTVDTKADAGQMLVVFQLRNASGKLWYDDVEVVKKGSVRTIRSF